LPEASLSNSKKARKNRFCLAFLKIKKCFENKKKASALKNPEFQNLA